jgi:hypothetical protein
MKPINVNYDKQGIHGPKKLDGPCFPYNPKNMVGKAMHARKGNPFIENIHQMT